MESTQTPDRALRQGDRRLDHAGGFGLPVRLLAPIGACGEGDDNGGSPQSQLGRIHSGVEDLQPEIDQTCQTRGLFRCHSLHRGKVRDHAGKIISTPPGAHSVDIEQAGDQTVRDEQLALVEVTMGWLQAGLCTGQSSGNLSNQPL